MLAQNGALADLINAGARILECACGPCIGMGQSPNSKGISLRTFNRNFLGRSGTADAGIYSGKSRNTAAVSALTGVFTDPAEVLGDMPRFELPEEFVINDNMIEPPATPKMRKTCEIFRGPNIKPFPVTTPLDANNIRSRCFKGRRQHHH